MTDPSFNRFNGMQFIPYNIIYHLMTNSQSENFWKILYYPTPDCLNQPNLTLSQKRSLIWSPKQTSSGMVLDGRQDNYNIFLTYLVGDMQLEGKTILKIYQCDNNPINKDIATLSYEIDMITGYKISIIDYDGIPVNRCEALEYEILQCLNGVDVAGAGFLQFNTSLNGGRLDKARANIGNNSTFSGISLILSVQITDSNSGASC